jgi:hypothetical protein
MDCVGPVEPPLRGTALAQQLGTALKTLRLALVVDGCANISLRLDKLAMINLEGHLTVIG